MFDFLLYTFSLLLYVFSLFSYLETLSAGIHTITAVFTDNMTATAKFSITEKKEEKKEDSSSSWTVEEISFWDKVVLTESSQESLRKELPQWAALLDLLLIVLAVGTFRNELADRQALALIHS